MITSKARISAFGAYVPEKRLTNHDLEKMVDTTDQWIIQRTGINDRYISSQQQFSSDLAVKAIENLAKTSGRKINFLTIP